MADTTARSTLERLRANKAKLDAERENKDRIENAALKAYVDQLGAVEKLQRQRQQKLDKLEQQITQVNERHAAAVAEVEQRQADALADLQGVGRTVDEIASMTELSTKKVRRLLKQARPAGQRGSDAGGKTEPSAKSSEPAGTTEPAAVDGSAPASESLEASAGSVADVASPVEPAS